MDRDTERMRELFFRTGLPQAYTLARAQHRRARARAAEEGARDAADHPGDRPPGDEVSGG